MTVSEELTFPQKDRYCINCKHHSQLGGFVLIDPRVQQHVCRHENNIVVDIDPVLGEFKYLFETCTDARNDVIDELNPSACCGLEGRWYEEKTPMLSTGESVEAPKPEKQTSPKEKFTIGDNL